MEQRDFLKDQIEQVAKALAKVIGDFLGMNPEINLAQRISICKEQLKEEMDLEIEMIMNLENKDLKACVINKNLNVQHITFLSTLLKNFGMANNQESNQTGKSYLLKALDLLDLADEISNSISYERIQKKKELKILINA